EADRGGCASTARCDGAERAWQRGNRLAGGRDGRPGPRRGRRRRGGRGARRGGRFVRRGPGPASGGGGEAAPAGAAGRRAAEGGGVHALLRTHLQSLAVDDLQGRRMAPEKLLDDADKGCLDREVLLPEAGREAVATRLLVVPLPPEQAGRARQKLRKSRK